MKKIKKLLLYGAVCALSLCCAVPVFADKNRDLREAAACGDLYGVKRLIKEGAYVNSKNYDGETPLILALKNNHEDVVKYLVENVEGVKSCGAEPMNVAYKNCGISMMQYLFNHGINEISDPYCKFEGAIYNKRYKTANFLLKHYNNVSRICAENFAFNLERVNEYDFCKLIDEDLIETDSIAYIVAYYKGYKKVCQKLKELCGDKVKLDLKAIKSAESFKADYGRRYREYIKRFIDMAVINEDKEAFEALINNGIMTEMQLLNEKKGRLFKKIDDDLTAGKFDTKNIKKLIDMGENKEQVNKILVTAIKNNEFNIVELFINSKFDINSRINYGDTALILASQWSSAKIVKILIDNGADVNVKNDYGNTALMVASKGKTEIVEFLVNNGADVNIKTACGNTALMVASQWGSAKIVKILIDNGADVNVKNNDKRTALDLAKKYVKKKWVHNKEDYIEIIQLLESFQPAKTTTKKSIFSKLFSKDKTTNKSTTITKNDEPIFQESIFTPQPNVPAVPTFQNNNSSNINKNFNTLNNDSATKDLFDGIEDDSFFDVLKAIKNGANVNAVNPENGMTPLMLAAVNGQLEIIKFLIQNHANVNEVFNNKTALKMAKNERIRQELINAGATI